MRQARSLKILFSGLIVGGVCSVLYGSASAQSSFSDFFSSFPTMTTETSPDVYSTSPTTRTTETTPSSATLRCASTSGAATSTLPACGAVSWNYPPSPSNFVAARSDRGPAVAPIDVPYGPEDPAIKACRDVDNISSESAPISFFVPFREPIEWYSFVNNFPSFASLAYCSRPDDHFVLEPDDACVSPSPNASVPVSLPYAREGAVETRTAEFSCDGGLLETVTGVYTAGIAPDADVTTADSGWTESTSIESSTAECGSADGVGTSTIPSTDLCSTGTASTVSGTGPWSWTCTVGTTVEASVSCSTPSESAACGPADGVKSYTKPTTGLCADGNTASAVSDEVHPGDYSGQFYRMWTCTDGSTTVTCKAPTCDCAMCGSVYNIPSAVPPTAGLCMEGLPRNLGTASSPLYVKKQANPRHSYTVEWYWVCDIPTNDHECYAPIE